MREFASRCVLVLRASHASARFAQWVRSNRGHPLTAYVLQEVHWHVQNALSDLGRVGEDSALWTWIEDQPHDAIAEASARTIGVESLCNAAEAAESRGDWWGAACRWGAACKLVEALEGRAEQCIPARRCMTAVAQINMNASPPPRCRLDDKDWLEMHVLRSLILNVQREDVERYMARVRYFTSGSQVAKADPASAFIMKLFGEMILPLMDCQFQDLSASATEGLLFLLEVGCVSAPDPETRARCHVLFVGFSGNFPLFLSTPTFTFTSHFHFPLLPIVV